MSSIVTLKATGLHTSPSELTRPEGSLFEASNVIIRRDNIIEQRRGYRVYGTELPETTLRVKQLTTYRNRIIRHYSNVLQFDSNGEGKFLSFAGSFSETQAGLRLKFIESNGNLYFTTSNGIKKISARTSADLTQSLPIKSAGAVKAIDLTADALYEANNQTGFLPQDSAVAYRVLWSYNDLNNNLIAGVPSQREIVYNSLQQLLIQDYMRVLGVIDDLSNTPSTSARINDKNYVATLKLNLNSTASELKTSLGALASKVDNDILYADQALVAPLDISTATITTGVCTVNFLTGNPNTYLVAGSKIFLSGFTPVTGIINGAQVITSLTANSISFTTSATGAVSTSSATIVSNEYRAITQPADPTIPVTNQQLVGIQTYLDSIIQRLRLEPTSVISTADQTLIDTLDITTTSNVRLKISIPEGLDSDYFYQIYRSAYVQATGAASLSDLAPNDELQQVYEAYPTSVEISQGYLVVDDITPEDFKGANLYTNPSSGEGILQANEQPPFAKDINRYRNSIFYANTRTKQSLSLNMVGVQDILSDYDNSLNPKIVFSNGTKTNIYEFIRGVNEKVDITTVADVANSLNGKYFLLYTPSNRNYYVYFETTSATDPAIANFTGIKVSLSTNDTANTVASKLSSKLSQYIQDFIVSVSTNVVTVEMYQVGYLQNASDVDTGFTIAVTQSGQGERSQAEISKITTVAASSYVTSGTADYIILSDTLDATRYVFYFKIGTVVAPSLTGVSIIPVELVGTETAAQVAQLLVDLIDSDRFTTSILSNVVTVTNKQYGKCTNIQEVVSNSGFLVETLQEGALEVLISPQVSPAVAVDETSKSLISVMNKNPDEVMYGFYLSSNYDIPGKMNFEAKDITEVDKIYTLASSKKVGESFNPTIDPETTITSITTGATPVITTLANHNMENGDQVVICNSNSVPSVDGLYTITYISANSFSINKYVGTAGTSGVLCRAVTSTYSSNEERPNRVYYSKVYQPEAVPLLNYFDVGAQNKAIIRILPLRDSLFVFKEDGLYRISGMDMPFQLELFDSSFIANAPDSIVLCNNIIYGWTSQGIQSLSEGGSYTISRPIDNIILKTQSSNFPNFKTATWAVGYESDNSYIAYTVKEMEDTVATIGYRYNTLTNTWTTFDQSKTCGIVNSFDDKVYLGCADIAYIEQERKTFSRLDYADREYADIIGLGTMLSNTIILPSVTGYSIGDVVVQDQTITTYEFNQLLEKLDLDPGVVDGNYLSTLQLLRGDSARTKLNLLAAKLDADTGVVFTNYASTIATKSGSITTNTAGNPTVITSASHGLLSGRVIRIINSNSSPNIDGEYAVTVIDSNKFSIVSNVVNPGTAGTWQTLDSNFEDLKTCYNFVCTNLNADTGAIFNNYRQIDNNTIQEAIITDINRVTKKVTLNLTLDYLAGDITVFKSIPSYFIYNPHHFGDPLFLKHLRETTVMFETRTLTGGTMAYATDLMPQLIEVPFTLAGNGIFGSVSFGEGLFGGIGNAAPFRTYIPRDCQRCRYLIIKFSHNYARESYRINGISVTGNVQQSTRAYR
jgi:hypothetical protein